MPSAEKKSHKILPYFLFALFIAAFDLRFLPIPTQLFFGPEQGRDALVIDQIIRGKPTLIGPKTDVVGIFHGPLFYYLLVIPYAISGGSPVAAAFFTILFHAGSVLLIYKVGGDLFSRRVGIIAAIMLTVSTRAIEYSRWLSNPALIPFFSLLLLWFLWQVRSGKHQSLYLAACISGILIHLQFLNGSFLALLLVIFCWTQKIKLSPKEVIIAVVIFLATLANFLIFDFRHDHIISQSLVLLLKGEKGFSSSFLTSSRETLEQFTNEATSFIAPAFSWFALVLIALGIFSGIFLLEKKKRGFDAIMLFVTIPTIVLALGRHSILGHFFLFISPFFILIVALFLDRVWQRSRFLAFILIGLLIARNLYATAQLKPWGITIGREKEIVDFIYRDAKGAAFRYEAYTIPYFWRDAWEYLFLWYGKKNYGYRPVAEGVDRVYFIWEDDGSYHQFVWFRDHVIPYGKIVASSQTGTVHVERRSKLKN